MYNNIYITIHEPIKHHIISSLMPPNILFQKQLSHNDYKKQMYEIQFVFFEINPKNHVLMRAQDFQLSEGKDLRVKIKLCKETLIR